MSANIGQKQSPARTLSIVTAEMGKPRVTSSAKKVEDALAEGRESAVTACATEMPVARDHGPHPLGGEELSLHLSRVSGWTLVHDRKLVRNFEFPDFRSALAFVVQIGAMAEELNHHPDIELGWGRVRATTWTHEIDGLSENDFALAARINQITR